MFASDDGGVLLRFESVCASICGGMLMEADDTHHVMLINSPIEFGRDYDDHCLCILLTTSCDPVRLSRRPPRVGRASAAVRPIGYFLKCFNIFTVFEIIS